MNVTLITPTPPDINAFGVRILSALLKREGFPTKVIFLPGGIEHLRFDAGYIYRYPDKTLDRISELCADADIVGVSFMSQYFDRAAQITEHLKGRTKAPIVWGGIHPTHRPEQSIELCDAVCIGEAEISFVELLDKMRRGVDYRDTKGFWFRTADGARKNDEAAFMQDLDSLPFPDYDLKEHYVFDWRTGDINQITPEIMKEQTLKMPYFKGQHLYTHRTMASRGCPHRCSYCASSAMGRLRRRGVDSVIRELKEVLAQFDYIRMISFFDDTFFAAPQSYFEEFRDKYKKEIGLPFHAQCSPSTMTSEKMRVTVDAGFYCAEMGIQTGSRRIQEMYNRTVPNERVLEVAKLLDDHRDRMLPPIYHIILDNPWETIEDVKMSLDLLLKIPGSFTLSVSSLMFFPGTELNERAKKEGFLRDELNEVCRKPFTYPTATWLNYLIYLSGFSPPVPRWLLRFLSRDAFVKMFHSQKPSKSCELLFRVTHKIRILCKGIKALFTGDFGRIANYFKLAR